MKYVFFKIVCFVLICGLSVSCEKFVEVDTPDHKIVSTTVFSNDETATSAVIGIYNQLFQSFFSGGGPNSVSILTGLSADNLRTTTPDLELMEFEENEISIESPDNLNLWSSAYNVIYMANAVMNGLDASEDVTDTLKDKLMGEAKFLRAFVYFYLVNLYGEVPLILTSEYKINATAPRNSKDEIYGQIIADLQNAIEVLGDGYEDGERLRTNRLTAKAFLARVYLYLGNWKDSEALSDQVITSTAFELLHNLNNVFLANSKEAIWQISPIGSISGFVHTNEGNLFIITNNLLFLTPVSLSENFINAYGTDDRRLNDWVNNYSTGSSTLYYPYKYKIKYAASGEITEYSMVLRLAEQYLIRSEARAQQGNLPAAISDLDKIRGRAGLKYIASIKPDISKQNLLDSILLERRRELFTEWGHRWLDIKRTGKISEVLAPKKPLWQNTDVLYPIPEEEIKKDPNMVQNEGY